MYKRQSLNLYEFSQVNNNEMGVLVTRSSDAELYKEAYEEAQRIIRISDEVRISLEKVAKEPDGKPEVAVSEPTDSSSKESFDTLTTSKLAQKFGIKTNELLEKLVAGGFLDYRDGKHYITAKGKQAGGEFRVSPKFGPYFLWPENMTI